MKHVEHVQHPDEITTEHDMGDGPEFWSELYEKYGSQSQALHYLSDRSHNRRLRKMDDLIRKESDRPEVLNLGCGLSFLDYKYGPYQRYVGVDFCGDYFVGADDRMQTQDWELFQGDLRDTGLEVAESSGWFDVSILCGITPVPGIWESIDDVAHFVRELLDVNKGSSVVLDFAWSGWSDGSGGDETIKYGMDEVVGALRDRNIRGEIEYGYLPHIFAVTCKEDRLP